MVQLSDRLCKKREHVRSTDALQNLTNKHHIKSICLESYQETWGKASTQLKAEMQFLRWKQQ